MQRKILAAGRSSLHISGTASVRIAAAAGTDEEQKLRRFSMTAYTGGPMKLENFDRPVYVDIAGVMLSSKRLPALREHDRNRIIGHTEAIEIGETIDVVGVISGVGPDAMEVMAAADNGFPWQASIGADVVELERVDRGATGQVNGRTVEGPAYIARRTTLCEISFVPIGADGATAASVHASKHLRGRNMNFETWVLSLGFEVESLTPQQRAALEIQFNAIHGEGAEGEASAETPPASPTEAAAVPAEGDDSEDDPEDEMSAGRRQLRIQASRRAEAAEVTRVADVRRVCAGASTLTVTVNSRVMPLEAHAIAEGWTAERTELEVLRRSRETAGPYIAARAHDTDCTLQALQGAMLLRAGAKLDHPAYQGQRALAMNIPAWMRENVNAERRQRSMEAAHRYSGMSMVDMCREAVRLDGRDVPHGRNDVIRAAFSGSALTNIFTNNINTVILVTYTEAPDSTVGWTSETDVNDFKTNERPRMTKGPALSKLPRGGEADHVYRSDTGESYKIARYAKQVQIDEQDIIDDHFGALKDMPKEMGLAAARLRPDLVYAILKASAALADGIALFHSSHSNTDTSAALAADKLKTGVTKISLQAENGVNLNLAATHLITPVTLNFTARELVNSTTIIIAGQTDTVRGNVNTLNYVGLEIRSDARLDNGVVDPSTGTSYSGDTNDWFLAASGGHTIEVGYLLGTGRAPQVRNFVLERGKWGVGWDINMDIGAKALDFKAMYRGVG